MKQKEGREEVNKRCQGFSVTGVHWADGNLMRRKQEAMQQLTLVFLVGERMVTLSESGAPGGHLYDANPEVRLALRSPVAQEDKNTEAAPSSQLLEKNTMAENMTL